MSQQRRTLASVVTVMGVIVLAACPGGTAPSPAPTPAPTANAPTPTASSAPVPQAGGSPVTADATAAVTISSTTYERTGSGPNDPGGHLTLGSTQPVPAGNNGRHDFLRAADACAAAGLASDGSPNLLWNAFASTANDQVFLKVDGVLAPVAGTIANPQFVEMSGPMSTTKVCVTGKLNGASTPQQVCVTMAGAKAAELSRWLTQATAATSVPVGLDPARCELRIVTASGVTSAELMFALKP